VKIGFDFGVTEHDVRALIADSAGADTALGAAERAVLAAARHLTTEATLTDRLFEALRPHFSDTDLVELLVIIGFYAGVVRVLASLGVDVEAEYQPYLDQFPLDAP
jgi:alkylhydroperoxidase family enzyme